MKQAEISAVLLSVVIPNYNHGHLIGQCIQALMKQEFRNFEVLIIDDASTDDSVEIINKHIGSDNRFRLVVNPRNLGVIKTLNYGVEQSVGEYIYLGAADDVTLPNLFSDCVDALKEDSSVSLVSMACLLREENDESFKLRPLFSPSARDIILSPKDFASKSRKIDNWIITGAAVFKRSEFFSAGKLSPSLGAFADGYLVRSIGFSSNTKFLYKIGLIWNRSSQGQSVQQLTNFNDFNIKVTEYLNLLDNNDLFPYDYKNIFQRRIRFIQSFNKVKAIEGYQHNSYMKHKVLWYLNLCLQFLRYRPFQPLAMTVGYLKSRHLLNKYRNNHHFGHKITL